METQRFVVRFPETESSKATQYARSLADSLCDASEPGSKVTVSRDNPESMDFGATVVLILGTTAATAIAKGIQTWLAGNAGARIDILKDGSVIARNLQSKDAVEIAKALSKTK